MAIVRFKPEKIGIKVSGRVIVSTNKWFKVKISIKENSKKDRTENNLIQRIIKLEKKQYGEYTQPMENSHVHVIYLNENSMKGYYTDPKKNLPYEVLNISKYRIYKPDIFTPKSKLLKKLEQAKLKEDPN